MSIGNKKKCKRINKRKPWLTKGLINACKKKNQMYFPVSGNEAGI